MKKAFFALVAVEMLLAASSAFAQSASTYGTSGTSGGALSGISAIITAIGSIINLLIPILVGAAVIVFFYGLVQYISKGGEGHKEGRNVMVAGITALFVMVSLWGIIQFIQNSLNIQGNGDTSNIRPPTVPLK